MDQLLSQPLFAQLLGPAFARLEPPVHALHDRHGTWRYAGQARVRRGRHWLVPVLAWGARLPPSHESLPTTVEFTASAYGERWVRRFGGHPMRSRLWLREGRLREQLGAVRFEFALDERDGAIHWQARRAWLFGVLPLPAGWFANVRCREYAVAGRYAFEVDVALPWVGPFIRYEGQLEPA